VSERERALEEFCYFFEPFLLLFCRECVDAIAAAMRRISLNSRLTNYLLIADEKRHRWTHVKHTAHHRHHEVGILATTKASYATTRSQPAPHTLGSPRQPTSAQPLKMRQRNHHPMILQHLPQLAPIPITRQGLRVVRRGTFAIAICLPFTSGGARRQLLAAAVLFLEVAGDEGELLREGQVRLGLLHRGVRDEEGADIGWGEDLEAAVFAHFWVG
jgi:hypothetical protein